MEARQTPTFERFPMESTTTDGPMGTQLASAFFGDPLPWQQHVLDVLLARDARDKYAYHAVALSVPRQNGKMLAESTEIPTPDGWKRLGDIRVGDYVFGDDGKPTMVVAKYEPAEPNHYEIDFGNAGNFVNETVKAGGGIYGRSCAVTGVSRMWSTPIGCMRTLPTSRARDRRIPSSSQSRSNTKKQTF